MRPAASSGLVGGETMRKRLLASITLLLALAASLAPAAAAGTDSPSSSNAVIMVAEQDLPALLASGALDDYTLVRASGSGAEALSGAGLGDEHALLTPGQIGLDTPNFYYPYYAYYPFYYPTYFYRFYPYYNYYPFFVTRVFVYRPFFTFPRFIGRVTVVVYP